jgi:hypothetical protein
MLIKKKMNGSFCIITDEEDNKRAINKMIEYLKGYNFRIVNESFVSGIEVYLETGKTSSAQYKNSQIKEIIKAFNKAKEVVS